MRISDWSSDVCSSDLIRTVALVRDALLCVQFDTAEIFPELEIDHASQGIRSINGRSTARDNLCAGNQRCRDAVEIDRIEQVRRLHPFPVQQDERTPSTEPAQVNGGPSRSEEHTSELQSLMRISYAVFCLKKKKN